jgi:D-alanyl-D-alanine carboxypeptidase
MTTVKHLQRFFIPLCLLLAPQLSQARHAAIVVDANSGNVLDQVEANQAWYPASLTKVMTLYMAFAALKTGELHLDDVMTVSSHAAQQKPSKLGLRTGEEISVEQAILAVITRSANDAAVVLGEELGGGSESRFATKMTSQAHALNMRNSYFMNATGLPHDRQVTTARDLAVLAWRIQRDFPEYYRLFSTHSFYFKGRELRSTNKFVASYPGAEGMKTGYTCGAGFNLIATAQQDGKRLIGVVLGGMTSNERYNLMYELMDGGFYSPASYNPNSRKEHLDTMSTYDTGAPPYQLDCGDRPDDAYAYKQGREQDDELAKADVYDSQKYVKKTTISAKSTTYHAVTSSPENRPWDRYRKPDNTIARTSTYSDHKYSGSATHFSKPSTNSTQVSYGAKQWAIDLGPFSSQMAAENANKTASLQLASTLRPARPLVVKRQLYNSEARWHALWSGYDNIYAAGDACKALWQKNVQCTVNRPEAPTSNTALR